METQNNLGPGSAAPTAETPRDDPAWMWLKAEWLDLADLERDHPRVRTDDWPARIRLEQHLKPGTRAVVEIFCVYLWHAGDERALYCDDWRTEDDPFPWHGNVDATLAKLPGDIARVYRHIEVDGDIPNTEPSLRWKRQMRAEEEYVVKDSETNEPVTDEDDLLTSDIEMLDEDCHDALDHNCTPAIPDGCDMDDAVDAGFNHLAIRTRRGNLWELCSLSGTILWDDYRAS